MSVKTTITAQDEDMALIDAAAEREGMSRSAYMVAASKRAAMADARAAVADQLRGNPALAAELEAARSRALHRGARQRANAGARRAA